MEQVIDARHLESVEAVASGAPFESLPATLTVQDVCTITGLSAQAVRRAIRSGQLEGFKINRRIFVARPVFLRFVKCMGLK